MVMGRESGQGTKVPCRVTAVLLGSGLVRDRLTHNRQRVFCVCRVNFCTRMSHWGLKTVIATIRQLWSEDRGQDVAEYAVMLAVILVIVIGTVRLIGGNANNVFSQVQSQLSN